MNPKDTRDPKDPLSGDLNSSIQLNIFHNYFRILIQSTIHLIRIENERYCNQLIESCDSVHYCRLYSIVYTIDSIV